MRRNQHHDCSCAACESAQECTIMSSMGRHQHDDQIRFMGARVRHSQWLLIPRWIATPWTGSLMVMADGCCVGTQVLSLMLTTQYLDCIRDVGTSAR